MTAETLDEKTLRMLQSLDTLENETQQLLSGIELDAVLGRKPPFATLRVLCDFSRLYKCRCGLEFPGSLYEEHLKHSRHG